MPDYQIPSVPGQPGGPVNAANYGFSSYATAAQNTLALQAAIDAANEVFVPGALAGTVTYNINTGILFRDYDTRLIVGAGAVFAVAGTGAFLSTPASLTARRWYSIHNMTAQGALIADQSLVKFADVGSRGKISVYDSEIYNFECLGDCAAGDVTYAEITELKFFNCYMPPPNLATPKMFKSKATGWGTTDYGIQVQLNACQLAVNLTEATLGWSLDFEGDIEINGVWAIPLKGTNRTFSFCGQSQVSLFGIGVTPSLESSGTSGWNTGLQLSVDLRSLEWKWNGRGERAGEIHKISITNGAKLTVKDPGLSIGVLNVLGTVGAIALDIEAGSDNVRVLDGYFGDCTTAAIRTAAQHGRFTGYFASTGAHATFLEMAGADDNLLVGCQGLATGAGLTLVGENSEIENENIFEGYLQRDSATQISLQRSRGKRVMVNGEIVGLSSSGMARVQSDNRIDSAGADAGAALAVNTLYYAYISNSRATFSPSSVRLSTVAPSAYRGIEYLGTSGNARNWRFVGWVRTISNGGTPNFADSETQRLVINRYNQRSLRMSNCPNYNDNNAATTYSLAGGGTVWARLTSTSFLEYISDGKNSVQGSIKACWGAAVGGPFFSGVLWGIGDNSATGAAVEMQPHFDASGSADYFDSGELSVGLQPAEGYRTLDMLAINLESAAYTIVADDSRKGASADPKLTLIEAVVMG